MLFLAAVLACAYPVPTTCASDGSGECWVVKVQCPPQYTTHELYVVGAAFSSRPIAECVAKKVARAGIFERADNPDSGQSYLVPPGRIDSVMAVDLFASLKP